VSSRVQARQSVSANGNEGSTGENCHIHFSCKCSYSTFLHNKTPIYSTWGLLRVCATCPTPRLNQSYELRPLWEQHLRYVPHRVRNGYNKKINTILGLHSTDMTVLPEPEDKSKKCYAQMSAIITILLGNEIQSNIKLRNNFRSCYV